MISQFQIYGLDLYILKSQQLMFSKNVLSSFMRLVPVVRAEPKNKNTIEYYHMQYFPYNEYTLL